MHKVHCAMLVTLTLFSRQETHTIVACFLLTTAPTLLNLSWDKLLLLVHFEPGRPGWSRVSAAGLADPPEMITPNALLAFSDGNLFIVEVHVRNWETRRLPWFLNLPEKPNSTHLEFSNSFKESSFSSARSGFMIHLKFDKLRAGRLRDLVREKNQDAPKSLRLSQCNLN